MAEIKIRLVFNVESGKKDIYIDFESDADALPIEHEQGHRAVIEQLLGKGILTEDELGEVKVERVAPDTLSDRQPDTPVSEPRMEGQSN